MSQESNTSTEQQQIWTLELAADFRESLRRAVFLIRALDGDADLTTSQVSTLNMLSEGPQRIGDIARYSGIKLPSATEQVSRLERAGLVRRVPDGSDARVVRVRLTDTGSTALQAANERRNTMVADRLQELSQAERTALTAAIPAMRHFVQTLTG